MLFMISMGKIYSEKGIDQIYLYNLDDCNVIQFNKYKLYVIFSKYSNSSFFRVRVQLAHDRRERERNRRGFGGRRSPGR